MHYSFITFDILRIEISETSGLEKYKEYNRYHCINAAVKPTYVNGSYVVLPCQHARSIDHSRKRAIIPAANCCVWPPGQTDRGELLLTHPCGEGL